MKTNKHIKTIFIPIIICFLISTILEITLFNFRYYQSRNYTPILGMPYTVSDNLNMLDVGTYEIGSLEYAPYIDVDISDVQIENVFLDIWPKGDVTCATRIRVHFYVSDEGNIVGYDMPTNDYLRPVWQTMYTPLDLSGKCNSFRIYIDDGINEGEMIRFSTIGFNVPVPFSMSKKRILALSVILILLYFLRPGSTIYTTKAIDKFKGKKLIIAGVLITQALLMWNICNLNVACKNPQFPTQHQFEMMAEALANGQLHLMETPPHDLINMENPYSFQARLSTGVEEQIMYDVAYYEGNYYVYFGVGPIILFYLPYFLITGNHIPTYVLAWIIGILVAGGWLFLTYELIKKYFKDFSFALYLVCSFLFSAGCGLTYVISRPDFYAIPMTMGLVCSLYGLGCWLKSIEDEKINPIWVCLGSLSMAFVAACRPQFLLGSFLALILFWSAVFKERRLFSGKSVPATICFVIPYIIVAAGVMYYNAARFGSPFDFGANYNLTFNDMTRRGFRIDRLLYGTLGFMFFPAKVTNHFPYFTPGEYITRYQGFITDEKLLGGLFYNQLYLLAIVFIPKCKKFIKDKAAFLLALVTPIFAIIIMIVDANMAGVLNRYLVDFSWLIIIAFFILFGYMITDTDLEPFKRIIAYVFYTLTIIALVHMFFMIFGGDVNGLENNGTVVFQKVLHLIEFWN